MITLDEVRALVAAAHAGQRDKLGQDYVLHHLDPVAERLREHGDLAVMAGLLHDVLEDTSVTVDDLRSARVPHEVIDAVEAVSRRDGEAYDDLVLRAAAHPLGRLVKLADNAHNQSLNARLAQTDPDTARRLSAKYERARSILLRAEETS